MWSEVWREKERESKRQNGSREAGIGISLIKYVFALSDVSPLTEQVRHPQYSACSASL